MLEAEKDQQVLYVQYLRIKYWQAFESLDTVICGVLVITIAKNVKFYAVQ